MCDTLQAVMISCQQRTEARALTIPQFEDIGIPVWVSLSPCSPAGPTQNNIASVAALHHAYEEGKHCLFLEDDVDINPPMFAWALSEAVLRDRVTYFYLHDKEAVVRPHYGDALAERIMRRLPIRRGLYPIQTLQQVYGTQAVFIPYWFLEPMVRSGALQAAGGSFDVFLMRYCITTRHRPLVALPHPVFHRHDRTARVGSGAGEKFTRSFTLPWFEAGENDMPVVDPDAKIDFRAENSWQFERLLPLWRALPWENRGAFYANATGWDDAPCEPLRNMIDKPVRTAILHYEGAAWAKSRTDMFKKRRFITVGGEEANVRLTDSSFFDIFQPALEPETGRDLVIAFVFTSDAIFAKHCRHLARIAWQVNHDVRTAQLVGNTTRASVRINSDLVAGTLPGGSNQHEYRVSGVATTDKLYNAAHQWVHRYGYVHTNHIRALSGANLVLSDDPRIITDVLRSGRHGGLLTLDGDISITMSQEPAPYQEPTELAAALLEVSA